jgi:hypothetical protein
MVKYSQGRKEHYFNGSRQHSIFEDVAAEKNEVKDYFLKLGKTTATLEK